MLIHVPENSQVKYVWDGQGAAVWWGAAPITFDLAAHAQLELQLELTNYPHNLALMLVFNLTGPGASLKFNARAILRAQQRIKITTQQCHLAPDTTSDLLLKTVCFDQSQWSYHGQILVTPAGRNSVASQLNHNLLISPNRLFAALPGASLARAAGPQAYSIPALEVLTNEVRCTHGSAMGQVDQDSLVYLQARGLSLAQAEQLLIASFLG